MSLLKRVKVKDAPLVNVNIFVLSAQPRDVFFQRMIVMHSHGTSELMWRLSSGAVSDIRIS